MKKLVIILLFPIYSFAIGSNRCIDDLSSLDNEKWKTTLYKLNKLKQSSQCQRGLKYCNEKFEIKTKKGSEPKSEFNIPDWAYTLPTSFAALQTAGKMAGTAVGIVGGALLYIVVYPKETSCADTQHSKWSLYNEDCSEMYKPFTYDYGFLPATRDFLNLSDYDKARELYLYPEFCEKMLDAYDTLYGDVSLQCQANSMTITNATEKTAMKVEWGKDGKLISIEDSDLYDPLKAYKLEYLEESPIVAYYIEPSALNLNNRNKRADFERTKLKAVPIKNYNQVSEKARNRLERLNVHLPDLITLQKCCSDPNSDHRRCPQVLPQANPSARTLGKQTKTK